MNEWGCYNFHPEHTEDQTPGRSEMKMTKIKSWKGKRRLQLWVEYLNFSLAGDDDGDNTGSCSSLKDQNHGMFIFK